MRHDSNYLNELADESISVLNNTLHVQHEQVKQGILILSMLFNKSRDEVIRKITIKDWS